jgi:16S rRNA (guanine527-N7)-methyltransferase
MVPEACRLELERLNVSRESLAHLEQYVATLEHWQKRINLIGPSTVENIWLRHILDGAQLLPLLPRTPVRIADLGSGAGIPGLILSLAGNHHVDLYESNGKKVAFLNEVIRLTGCPARTVQTRIETLSQTPVTAPVDFVVARALAPLDQLLDYASPFLAAGAKALFHKGQDVDAELTGATKYWKIKSHKHPSLTDSRAVILEIEEAVRVRVPSP